MPFVPVLRRSNTQELIDDEGISLAKEHGTYLDMDLYDEECIQGRDQASRF